MLANATSEIERGEYNMLKTAVETTMKLVRQTCDVSMLGEESHLGEQRQTSGGLRRSLL